MRIYDNSRLTSVYVLMSVSALGLDVRSIGQRVPVIWVVFTGWERSWVLGCMIGTTRLEKGCIKVFWVLLARHFWAYTNHTWMILRTQYSKSKCSNLLE